MSLSEERLAEIRQHETDCPQWGYGPDWAFHAIGDRADLLAELDRLRAENERLSGELEIGKGSIIPDLEEDVAMHEAYVIDLEAERDSARATIEAVRKLHKPEKRWQASIDDDHSWDTPEEARDEMDDPGAEPYSFEICQHCGDIEGRQPYLDFRESLWPCATAKALGGPE